MEQEDWACAKGFHAWGIIYAGSAEAEVTAGIPHPLPTNYSCVRCGAEGPAIKTTNGESLAEPPARFSGRCIFCQTRITAETVKEWIRKVRAPCPACRRDW